MNISKQATQELRKPVKERDYTLINLDLARWRDATIWLDHKPRAEIRKLLSTLDSDTQSDMRRRLNHIAARRKAL